ncbi:MAG TPA: hypothetical protein VHD90_04370 [Phototrophicaceae bacterium]|nr:hypothetical protein [Phototrophicaceae bacterium]
MITKSKNGIEIRLPDERWAHIITEHAELAQMKAQVLETIANPERILAGNAGELFAVREVEAAKWLVVIYRESDADGFIITAFLTRRGRSLEKRQVVWRS